MSGKVIGAIYEFETGVEKNNGIPSTAWIAMGTDLENTEKAPAGMTFLIMQHIH